MVTRFEIRMSSDSELVKNHPVSTKSAGIRLLPMGNITLGPAENVAGGNGEHRFPFCFGVKMESETVTNSTAEPLDPDRDAEPWTSPSTRDT